LSSLIKRIERSSERLAVNQPDGVEKFVQMLTGTA